MPQQPRATISGHSAVYVILADPVAQVRTPQMMNAHFDAIGLDGVLVPLHVPPEALATVIAGLRPVRNLRGIVITVPHKQAVLALVDDATEAARQVGAVNVIRRDADGRLTGGQFDGEGFCTGLEQAGHAIAGRRVFLSGAGGAASGIGFALARHGASALTIHNRDMTKAAALAARIAAAYPGCAVAAGADPAGHAIAVNGTSLGMAPGDGSPIDVARLDPGSVAAEVIMTPAATPYLAAATARGLPTHGGAAMLQTQVALLTAFMQGEAG
ncbi:MAG TPA: shikimate dehydrogenase [Roseomonas sp.]|jgi:shikimate dehydrogenase